MCDGVQVVCTPEIKTVRCFDLMCVSENIPEGTMKAMFALIIDAQLAGSRESERDRHHIMMQRCFNCFHLLGLIYTIVLHQSTSSVCLFPNMIQLSAAILDTVDQEMLGLIFGPKKNQTNCITYFDEIGFVFLNL